MIDDGGDGPSRRPPGFLCECSDPRCNERLPLGMDEYDRLHARADVYSLVPGHEVPDVEVVVERAEGWVAVRKTAPTSAPEVQA